MRSIALAFVSTLLLSPISVLATYGEHGEHGHHPDHPHHSDEADHAVSKVSDLSTEKIVRIVVKVDFLESDVKFDCNRKEDTCLERHDCHEKDESCGGRKNKCHKKKNKCLEEYKCNKKSKICHKQTTKRYGFRCGKKFYNQANILAAAKVACKKIGSNPQSGAFPAIHTAYKFHKSGPYVEWPVTRNGKLHRKWSKSRHRLVMTMDCGVVGAVIRHRDGDYTKCKYKRH